MTIVSFPDIVTSFKESLSEYLTEYFDGDEHEIQGTPYRFPKAKIVFDIRSLLSPKEITIALIGSGVFNQRELKCENPVYEENNPGVELRADVSREVVIAAPIEIGGAEWKNRKAVDTTWGLLYAVISQRPLLAQRNIFLPEFTPVPTDLTTKSDLAEASGTLRCEIRVQYGRYTLEE